MKKYDKHKKHHNCNNKLEMNEEIVIIIVIFCNSVSATKSVRGGNNLCTCVCAHVCVSVILG